MVLGSDPRRLRGRGVAATAVLVLAAALTACGDDSGGASTSAPTPSVERTGGAGPSATAPADPAAAEAQVRENWEKFFDPGVGTKDKRAVLENGDRMAPVLKGFNGDRRGQEVRAKVEKVEFTSPAAANVTYTLTLKGATALPDAAGTAVEQDGTWKVSVNTLCALVKLSGDPSSSAAPGC
ncbi:hypothetical protein AB0912_08745 [Streptomyces sp. NPDC007084]|uniref:hypothetical protein n=1 Tax=Streptomyces sp. NPDC007084 TaxID=3154313 RepID=UPI003454E5E9